MITLTRRQLVIGNTLGFHLRAAGKFAELAQGFQSDVVVYRDDKQACGKSIIELTMLAAECGTAVEVEANGPDAEEAVESLAELIEARFHEID
jgi:phosphocarrier protein HPr